MQPQPNPNQNMFRPFTLDLFEFECRMCCKVTKKFEELSECKKCMHVTCTECAEKIKINKSICISGNRCFDTRDPNFIDPAR